MTAAWEAALAALDPDERADVKWLYEKCEIVPDPVAGKRLPGFDELSDAAQAAWLAHVERRRQANAAL
jgi:hypothetical protein